jgi:hypothetical protein
VARRALQERRYAQSRPISSGTAVAALSAVLQHQIPHTLAEAQRDPARLVEQLRIARAQVTTGKNTYSTLRYQMWQLAQAGIQGVEWDEAGLENVVRVAEDSDDD